MTSYRSLNHTKWACQYHVVFIPKYRKKVIYGEMRRYLGEVLRRLAQHRESELPWSAYGQPDARHVNRFLVQVILEGFIDAFYGPVAARLYRRRLRWHRARPPRPFLALLWELTRACVYALDRLRVELAKRGASSGDSSVRHR